MTVDKKAAYVLNDLLDVVAALAVMVEELNPGRSEDHRMVKFLINRASRELKGE